MKEIETKKRKQPKLGLLGGGFFLLLMACVPGDDFEVPEAAGFKEVQLETNVALKAVIGAFRQREEELLLIEEDWVMEAYVVSSDESGNFYKELILQDAPENPQAGIVLQLNQASYYETFDFGRKVYVNLRGLTLGELNGVLSLGISQANSIGQIPQARIPEYLVRSSEVVEITPLPVKVLEFSDELENLYVSLEEVQFSSFLVREGQGFTFGSEANDEFDGERLVESCTGDFPFVLSTSTFADFKGLQLPAGSGSLKGILTRDFYDEFFTLYLNSPEDLAFDQDQRCDPEVLDCGLANSTGQKVLFWEDFETQKNNSPIAGNGWTNLVEEGSEPWEGFSATGGNASLGTGARVQTAGSGDYRTRSWLITPPIDFTQSAGEVLEFKTSTSFANGSMLEVFISTDWEGTPGSFSSATWKVLGAARTAQREDFFGDWISSGRVDLSCVEGTGYIGFRFTGSDLPYYDGVYELDEVLVSAK